MALFLFDCGGTLIDDPFADALERFRRLWPDSKFASRLQSDFAAVLSEHWADENAAFSFPLASHFLQEEVWVIRALDRLAAQGMLGSDDIPLLAPSILGLYRECAKAVVSQQPQLPSIRTALRNLKSRDVIVGVASNDRDFATRALLSWSGLSDLVEHVFTSDGLSTASEMVEKPSRRFFERVEESIGRSAPKGLTPKVYVGDNERNDVEAPSKLGYITVRYINSRNPASATWLDHRTDTSADYRYNDPAELAPLLDQIARAI